MPDLLNNINFWSALSGLIGSIIWFFTGLPPHANYKGQGHLLAEQEDESEAKKYELYKKISRIGLSLIVLSFFLQIIHLL